MTVGGSAVGGVVATLVGAVVADGKTVFVGFCTACAVCVPANAFWIALFGRGEGNGILLVEVRTETGEPEADLWQAVTRVKSKIAIKRVRENRFFMVNLILVNIIYPLANQE